MKYTLVELRKKRQITQKELADEIGVSKGAVAMWETNKRTPPLFRATAIANFFGVQIEDIIFKK